MKNETYEIPFSLKPDAGGTRAVIVTVQANDLADAVRVACHRMRYQGWLEHEFELFLDHHRSARPEPPPAKPFCVPHEAGLGSEAKAVAKALSDLLTMMGRVNNLLCSGELPEELWQFRINVHKRLEAEGWRISAKIHQGWRVLPPKRRDSVQDAYDAREHMEDAISKPGQRG